MMCMHFFGFNKNCQNVNDFFCLKIIFPFLMAGRSCLPRFCSLTETKNQKNINGNVDLCTNYFGRLDCSKVLMNWDVAGNERHKRCTVFFPHPLWPYRIINAHMECKLFLNVNIITIIMSATRTYMSDGGKKHRTGTSACFADSQQFDRLKTT